MQWQLFLVFKHVFMYSINIVENRGGGRDVCVLIYLCCRTGSQISRILNAQGIAQPFLNEWVQPVSEQFPFDDLSGRITALCRHSDKPAILMIDEVDKSSDNQVFLSFLGLLRNKDLEQMQKNDDTFQSVALAGGCIRSSGTII